MTVGRLLFSCAGIEEGGEFPIIYTGRGENISPEFHLKNLDPQAETLALTLEDLNHPLKKEFTHWLIWDIPARAAIPSGIPKGKTVAELGHAKQGLAYGWHCYAGPKPPFGQTHRYRFTLYSLNRSLDLSPYTRKSVFLKAASPYILQKGELTASFGSKKESEKQWVPSFSG
ncbi:YbhB/YbcL family Raf kinase inhibitor-like protein [Streptococcus sp. H31]|uniref:YbhB/YbcL family Raf kinase inhibitor-like protein n=1 Tax=Streptococcus huangxiaojuni TaxID=3237239 RepID=UPI0034A5BDFB